MQRLRESGNLKRSSSMNTESFDVLIRASSQAPTRRGMVRLIAVAALSGEAWFDQAEAKHGRPHKRKKRHKRPKQNTNQIPPSPPADVPPPLTPPPPPPAPVLTPDATCSQLPNGESGNVGDARLAHTFTAVGSGPLVRADLLLRKREGSIGDY